MAAEPIVASDLTYLTMDKPNNLIIVHSVMWFDDVPDWEGIRHVLKERLIDRFHVLRSRPRQIDGEWFWEEDPHLDLDRHVRHVTLPSPGDRAAAQDYVSSRISDPMDRDRPLWEVDFVDGYREVDGGNGSLMLMRFHHALADGIRLVQLMMGLCDTEGDAAPPRVGRGPKDAKSPTAAVADVAKDTVGQAASFAGDVAFAAVSAVPKVPGKIAGLGVNNFYEGWGLLTKPIRLTDAISGLAAEDNTTINTLRSAARLTLWGNESRLVADKAPGVPKRVAWVTGLEVARVKGVGAKYGTTLNNVLLSTLSLAVTEYLQEKGRKVPVEANFMVPISLKPMDMSLPKELGNHFAMVFLPMPLGISDPEVLIPEVASRMDRIKNSAEAMIVIGAVNAIAKLPQKIGDRITDTVANKSVGFITNVPGPRVPVYLAGNKVGGILGWVPSASDQNMGFAIFSYNGEVSIGILCDEGILPDPAHLAELIEQAFESLT
jgi:diacylglycerol O-acyltransferase